MARVLLLLPSATYRATDFLDAARSLGDVEVIVASNAEQTMAEVMGDRQLTLDLSDPAEAARAIVEHSARTRVDAVVAVDDQGVQAAALAAEELGFPHSPPQAVAATRNKAALRQALDGHVPQPAFRVAGNDDDVPALAAELGFPVVVKPVSLSASRGVIRADDATQAEEAADRIRTILACSDADPEGSLLVESFAPGVEVALEGLVRDGELEVLAIFDKPDPLEGPYFEETLYVTPSRLPEAAQQEVARVAQDAVRALGLTEGPVHAELRVDGDRVTFLEVGARSIGGLCARSLRFGLGIRLEELILRHALGRSLETLRREPHASGVMMLPIPRAGVLREVNGTDDARAVDGIVGLEITIPLGRQVEPLPEGDRYLGFLFARGDTPDDVERALREGHARLDVVIDEG